MRKKKLLAAVLAVMLLMAYSMTAMAITTHTQNGIYGSLTLGTSQANAATTNQNGGSSYVYVRVYYTSPSGVGQWSSPASEGSPSQSVNVSRYITGSVLSAESGHGKHSNSIEFNLFE